MNTEDQSKEIEQLNEERKMVSNACKQLKDYIKKIKVKTGSSKPNDVE